MTKTNPGHLRIHRAPSRDAQNRPTRRDASIAHSIDQFWTAYTQATGYRVDVKELRRNGKVDVLPVTLTNVMTTAEDYAQLPTVSQSDAKVLAELAFSLTSELKKSCKALRRNAAELAARAAILATNEERSQLADSIEQALATVAKACGCDRGAIYLLDNDTQYLELRFALGLSVESQLVEARELRGSRGDLEALVQNVVCIDRVTSGPIDTWNCPEPAEAAICASITDNDLPLGTMWLFSDEPQSFTEADEAVVRLATQHISRELTTAATPAARPANPASREWLADLAEWQHRCLPIGSVLAEGWLVDGMIDSPNPWAIGWHTWDVLPDGTLLIAIAEADDESITGAMTANVARIALTAHTGYRHTPRQLLQRISDTLWQTNTGDQLVSMLCAHLDPDTGEGEVASAGNISAMVASRYGFRALASEASPPLGTSINPQIVSRPFSMTRGETLLAHGIGWTKDGANQQSIGGALRDSLLESQPNPLAILRRKHAQMQLLREHGALSIYRA